MAKKPEPDTASLGVRERMLVFCVGSGMRDTEAGILLNEHIAEDGPTVFAHACRLGAEGIASKEGRWRLPVQPVPRLGQGPQSRQRRGAAGEERDLESMSLR
jgi:hypothetical protein